MTQHTTVLAVDSGKSGTRVRIRGANRLWQGETTGTFYHADVDSVTSILDAIARAVTASGYQGPIDQLCAGLTGLPGDEHELARLRAGLATRYATDRLLLVEDSVTAHFGALGGAGTVVSAGTGVAVLALNALGTAVRKDGWGPLLGDRGSGFDIGMAGLRQAWAAVDTVGEPTLLVDAMKQHLGGLTVADVQRFFAEPDIFAHVSAFALAVFEAARAGDLVAVGIVREASAALAATVAAAAMDVGEGTVSYSGRLFSAGKVLLEPFERELAARRLRLCAPRGNPLDGALGLADAAFGQATEAGPYRSWLDVRPAGAPA